MAKKSGKHSPPAAKRRKAPKEQAAVADAAVANGPHAAVVAVGQGEGTAAETVSAQTVQHEEADSDVPGAEPAAETHEARPPAQAAEDGPEPAPGSGPAPAGAVGDAAAAEAAARPQGRGKTRAAKTRPADAAAKAGKLSALDAAAQVLAEEGRTMGCPEMIAAMAAKGYWTSPGGKTPAATLYSALLNETRTKGTQSRFIKTGRGTFGLAARVRRRPAHGRHGGPALRGPLVVGARAAPSRPVASWANMGELAAPSEGRRRIHPAAAGRRRAPSPASATLTRPRALWQNVSAERSALLPNGLLMPSWHFRYASLV